MVRYRYYRCSHLSTSEKEVVYGLERKTMVLRTTGMMLNTNAATWNTATNEDAAIGDDVDNDVDA